MSSNAKFGCLLYSTDLPTLYEDDMLFRRAVLSKKRTDRATSINKVYYKKVVKPVDFFCTMKLQSGINVESMTMFTKMSVKTTTVSISTTGSIRFLPSL